MIGISALVGLLAGYLQYRIFRALLGQAMNRHAVLPIFLKLILWAVLMGGTLLWGVKAMLISVAAATLFYMIAAVRCTLRVRKEG